MKIHIDPLYQQHMKPSEYNKLYKTISEFGEAATRYDKCLSDRETTSFLWDIVIGRKKVEVDILRLQFSFPGHSPSKVQFPILAIHGLSALDLFLYYLKALDYPKLPVEESQS